MLHLYYQRIVIFYVTIELDQGKARVKYFTAHANGYVAGVLIVISVVLGLLKYHVQMSHAVSNLFVFLE